MESNLEADLRLWKEREQRYEKLFSASVLKSREFLREKLRHYDEIRAKAVASPVTGDKIAMRALELERAQLARQVFPNAFRRLLDRIVIAFTLGNKVAQINRDVESNSLQVQDTMTQVGLGNHYKQAAEQMKQGQREFSLPVSYHVNEHEKMDLLLHFKKDGQGIYHFENYKAALHSDQVKGPPKEQVFNINELSSYNPGQAYNLLAGRAVQNNNGDNWHQLDFNDRDASGNYRLRHFQPGYGFDLEKALTALPIKERDQPEILEQLKQGNKVAVPITIKKEAVLFQIQADPLRKQIALYDNAGNKVKLEDLMGTTGQNKSAKVQQLVPVQQYNKTETKNKQVKL